MRCAIIHYDRDRIESVKSTLAQIVPSIGEFIPIHQNWFDSPGRVLELLRENYEVVVLPLSLPGFAALRAAELVHSTNSSTRLVLYSGTNRLFHLRLLFDYFWWSVIPLSDADAEDLCAALSKPPQRLESGVVQCLIEATVRLASCFRSSNINDYRVATVAGDAPAPALESLKEVRPGKIAHLITSIEQGTCADSADLELVIDPSNLSRVAAKLPSSVTPWGADPALLADAIHKFNYVASDQAPEHELGEQSAAFALVYSRLAGREYDEIAYRFKSAVPNRNTNAIQCRREIFSEALPMFTSHEKQRAEAESSAIPPGSINIMTTGVVISLESTSAKSAFSNDGDDFAQARDLFRAMEEDAPEAEFVDVAQQLHSTSARWLRFSDALKVSGFPRFDATLLLSSASLGNGALPIFISHRWLSRLAPDPDHRHFFLIARVLVQSSLEAVVIASHRGLHTRRRIIPAMNHSSVGVSGSALAEAILVNVLRQVVDEEILALQIPALRLVWNEIADAGGLPAVDLAGLVQITDRVPLLHTVFRHLFLWFDYSCVTQDEDRSGTADRDIVLAELHQYIESSFFLSLVDSKGAYFGRAWCAFETLAAVRAPALMRLASEQGGPEIPRLEALPHHFLEIARRAILETEVFGLQTFADCMSRMGLTATRPDDLHYLYGQIRDLAVRDHGLNYDDAEIVTGCFPVFRSEAGDHYPSHVWSNAIEVEPVAATHFGLFSDLKLASIPASESAYQPFIHYEHPTRQKDTHLHIVVIGSCEAESILWSRHVDSKAPLLEKLLGRRIASRSWVATDFAPVGKLPFAKIFAAGVMQRDWVLVTTTLRMKHCPLVKHILEGIADNHGQVFLLLVDGPTRDFFRCEVRLTERVGGRSDPVVSTLPPRAPIDGGLFRNTIPDFLPPASYSLNIADGPGHSS